MTNPTLDAIKEGSRFARMRMGQDAPDITALKSRPEVRVALVPLIGKEDHQAWIAAASLEVPENAYGAEARDYVLKTHTLLHAIRQPDNLAERVFPSIEELDAQLEDIDINYLSERYQLLKADSSPALDGLTDDELGELKKVWNRIELSALSGRSWELAKQVLFETSAATLTARSRGLSSIKNLIGTNDEIESTPGV